jgi:hypothetical protein
VLIASRILQAVGAAAPRPCNRHRKDIYDGKRLERTIAAVRHLVIVPVASPMLGALILRNTDWRGAFSAQPFWAPPSSS